MYFRISPTTQLNSLVQEAQYLRTQLSLVYDISCNFPSELSTFVSFVNCQGCDNTSLFSIMMKQFDLYNTYLQAHRRPWYGHSWFSNNTFTKIGRHINTHL